jgi:metallo-beta-lactamase family protein
LYTVVDAAAAMAYFRLVPYGEPREIAPGIRVRLHDAGHILGSSIVEIQASEGANERTVVFSGDLGHRGAPVLRDPSTVARADVVVLESTYGDREHRSWNATWEELGQVLSAADRERGNVLIPAFAVGRTQEILFVFRKHFAEWGLGRWRIHLDSPMAIEATRVYARHPNLYDEEAASAFGGAGDAFLLPNLRLSRTAAESIELNGITAGAIVIAGSGMCSGGRIRHHLRHNLGRRACHVVIVGFQAAGTLGRKLVDGAKVVRIQGEEVEVEARIHTIGGLSAHADRAGLVDWYGAFESRPAVVLNHGEPAASQGLAAALHARYGIAAKIATQGFSLELSKTARTLPISPH